MPANAFLELPSIGKILTKQLKPLNVEKIVTRIGDGLSLFFL